MSHDTFPIKEEIEAKLQSLIDAEKARTPEEKAKLEAERIQQKENDDYWRIKQILDESGIPLRHRDRKMAGKGSEQEQAFEKLSARLGTGFLVALVGPWGTGKTQMAVGLIRKRAWDNKASKFITAMEFFMEIKAGFTGHVSEERIVNNYANCGFLVIDEIGKRAESEWENRLLYELLNRRYGAMKDTLLITNQEPATFEQAIGPALVSRMREAGGIIECNWKSYRG